MIISHKLKIIFIHVQRTGGSSIINLLKSKLENEIEIIAQHGNAQSPENYLLQDYEDYFTFGFVRNPYERILSWYLLINKGNQDSIEEERVKYENFLELNHASKINDPHFHYNQLDYFSYENGSLVTDKIFRFENYASEVNILSQKLNLPTENIIHLNKTWSKDYRDYYTPKSQKLIAEKCFRDLEYFKYCF